MNKQTWKRLFTLIKTEKIFLYWGMFFLILSSGSTLIFPQLTRWLIDFVLTPKKYDLLAPAVAGIFCAFVIMGFAGSLRYYFFTLSGERMVLHLRRQLYKKILAQDVAFFDANRTGDLMSRLSSDCTTLQNTVSVNVSMGLRNLAQVLGGFSFMFYTSWKLSSLMLLMIPPIALSTVFFGKKIRKLSHDFQGTLAEASIVADETISGIRTVKSFVQEEAEVIRYNSRLEIALDRAKKRVKTIALFMTVAMVVGFGAISFVLWYGGHQVVTGVLSIGDLTQFLLYLMIVAIGVGSLGGLWGDIMAGIGASKRVFDIIELEPFLNDSGKKITTLAGTIEFKDVSFCYPMRANVEVLKKINFKINTGEMIALVGPSGSGKTTIGSLIPRFYELNSGEILIDNEDYRNFNPYSLREHIGIVSQEPILISSTIKDNIRYSRPNATEQEVRTAARDANALDFIEAFPEGFNTLVGEKGIQLSGGQKQRVAIARALLKSPKILILDEATSNLDTASESLVQEALNRLMKGRTTLVIAHRLSTIKEANKIFVLDKGEIIQTGTHDELILDHLGLYYHLLQRQFS
ncbi:MAG: ABC transporter transmembrane domain-containing protein [Bacteriovorax sp.]|nr:ABC transporter transmembrane domain-containing protein [Bacteriovorax sp.]